MKTVNINYGPPFVLENFCFHEAKHCWYIFIAVTYLLPVYIVVTYLLILYILYKTGARGVVP